MLSSPSYLTKKPHAKQHSKNNYLSFEGLKKLPESFVWNQDEDPSSIDKLGDQGIGHKSIPIINLDDQNAQQYIGLACKSWGVFQVTNHGISKILLDNIEAASKNLFNLPAQQKLKVARSSNGITGYGQARISSFFPKRMWSEGFTILGSPLHHARKLWPNDYENFCDIITEYEKAMNQLANKLIKLILSSLGISKQDIQKWVDLLKGSNGAIQLNHYPICPDPNRAMGLAAHTDSTLLTILHQNRTTGLQVFKDQTGWVTVPPLSNGLIINIGDLLHIMSNGQYKSVYHRAMVNKAQHRLSVAYLYGPSSGVQIQPLPKLLDVANPPLYKAVTWSEYLAIKGKHFNKALSLIRLNHSSKTTINGPITSEEPQSIKVDSNNTILAATA